MCGLSPNVHIHAIYIFTWSVCLFCCRKICGQILGIYKSLTNEKIGTEAAQFPEKEYINGIFVAMYPLQTGSFYVLPVYLLCRRGERHDERADQHEDPTRRHQGGEGDCQERRRPLLLYVHVLMSHMCETGKAKWAFIPLRTIYIAENLGTAPHIHVKYLCFFSTNDPMIRKNTCRHLLYPGLTKRQNIKKAF